MRRLLAALLGAVLVGGAGSAAARAFDIDDLLASESFGRAVVDPTGRWLVFEQRDAYATAPRFDYNTATRWAVSRLKRVDLTAPSAVATPLAADAGPGVLLAGFSPGGTRLAVYRLRAGAWTLGVVTLATGAVTWWPITPQEEGQGRALQWRSEDELLVIARLDGQPPLTVRQGFLLATRLPALWAAAAAGDGAHTVLGSGRYAGVRRRAEDTVLLSLDLAQGRVRTLATGPFVDLELAPGGRRVALLALGPDLQARPDGPARGPRGFETEARRLQVLDLATGSVTAPCPACDVLPQLLSWSPAGRRLLVLDRGPDGLWSDGRFRTVEAATSAVIALDPAVRPRLDPNPVRVWTAWMGDVPLVFGRRGADAGRDDWLAVGIAGSRNLTAAVPAALTPGVRVAGPGRLSVLAAGQVWTMDDRGRVVARSGPGVRVAVLGPPDDSPRLGRAPRDAGGVVVESVRVGGWRRAGRLTADGLRVTGDLPDAVAAAAAGAGGTSGVVRAAGDGVWAVESVDNQGVGQLAVAHTAGVLAPVATVNAGWSGTDPMIVQPIRHRDGTGRMLTSWLYRPPGWGRRPLLVRPYLGSAPAVAPGTAPETPSFMLNLRLLVGRGYAVLLPALPAPPEGLVEPAAEVADRILAAVDAALADPEAGPRLDPGRLAIVGYSFGGYTTLATLTQTDRFRAAVAISGYSDFAAAWGSLTLFAQVAPDQGYTSLWPTGGIEATQPQLGAPPWAVPDRYVRNSPLYAADRIVTPLLLIHGAQDQIPLTQSEAMYSALFRQGKDAQLVTYHGALHTVTSPGDIRDMYARIFAFLDDRLGGPP